MNELIQELAYQAEDYADGIVDQGGEFHPAYTQKLAELIVRECVIQCEREWIRHGTDSVHNQAIHGCINSIKKHFGVEE